MFDYYSTQKSQGNATRGALEIAVRVRETQKQWALMNMMNKAKSDSQPKADKNSNGLFRQTGRNFPPRIFRAQAHQRVIENVYNKKRGTLIDVPLFD